MARIQGMELGSNNLRGTIPADAFASMRNLSRVDLSDNQIRGTIPTEIGSLRNAEVVRLRKNLFSGTIPAQLGLMGNSTRWTDSVYLGTNLILGTLPFR